MYPSPRTDISLHFCCSEWLLISGVFNDKIHSQLCGRLTNWKVTEYLYRLGIDPVTNIINKTICRIFEKNVHVITIVSAVLYFNVLSPLRQSGGYEV